MVEPTDTYTVFEIAAGTGMLGHGLRLALQSIEIRTHVVGGCEWESCAAATFLAGLELSQGGGEAVWDDARTFAPRRWRSRIGSVVDVVCAGYPCQPFSAAGKRLGEKDPRHLWPAVRRIVARLQPSIVFFENVDGHVTLGLWKVLRDLERLGYQVAPGVFSAEEVGAPHLRKRVFIVGVLGDSKHSTEGIGRSPVESVWQRRQRTTGRSEELANDNESGLQGGRHSAPKRQRGANVVGGESDDTAGPRHVRAGQRTEADIKGWERMPGEGRPIFPPGQDDYDRWAQLAAEGLDPSCMPAIESGVSVVAHGMASPADLLRLGGNGVVPLQAAWAFLQLFACLMEPVGRSDTQSTLFDLH